MSETVHDDYARKLDELDQLMHDATAPIQPALIWRLIDDVIHLGRYLAPSE